MAASPSRTIRAEPIRVRPAEDGCAVITVPGCCSTTATHTELQCRQKCGTRDRPTEILRVPSEYGKGHSNWFARRSGRRETNGSMV